MVCRFNGFNCIISFILIILSEGDIINNPTQINNEFVIKETKIIIKADSLNIKGIKTLKIIKDDINELEYEGTTYSLSSNTFLCKDESDNYFLFSEYNYYKIDLKDKNKIKSITFNKALPSDVRYRGFIQEKEIEYASIVISGRGNIVKNEIIIYGTKNNYLYFNYLKEFDYSLNIDNIGEIISCRLIRTSRYLCAYFQNNNIKISIIILIYKSNEKKELQIFQTIEPSGFTGYNNFILYDTKDVNYKVFCATKIGETKAKCLGLYMTVIYNPLFNKFEITFKSEDLKESTQDLSSKKHKCYITGFNSEFLLCCSDNNVISCKRKDKKLKSTKDFSLNLIGKISSININDNSDSAIISYINNTSSDYLFQYYIYPPKCKNVIKNVTSSENFEIILSDLFERKTNTFYYLKFKNLPSSYGAIKLGENIELDSIDDINITDPEITKICFISNQNESVNNIRLNYVISIKETYSSQCSIYLNFGNDNQIYNPFELIEEEKEEEEEEIEEIIENEGTISFIEKICYFTCIDCNENPKMDENGNLINQNCLKCIEGYNLMYGTKNCYNNEIIKEGYYLGISEKPYTWKECHENCQTCNESETSDNMNCICCRNNLYLTLEGNCETICPNNTVKYNVNYTCLDSCPDNYQVNNKENKCELKSFEQASLFQFKSQVMDNISQYMNSSSLINGSDFLGVILSSHNMDPKDQLKLGISAIDLGNCTEVIKEYYNISNEESLIVMNIESKNNGTKKNDDDNCFNLGKNQKVEIYDFSGRKLDLSVCKEDIKVMKYIGDVKELDIQTAKSLSSQGIDVFNASDEFFNDLCHKYNNEDGKDIIIDDRRKDIYQNATFCQNGCTYSGMDYELMTANCICDSSVLQESPNVTKEIKTDSTNINFNTLAKSFIFKKQKVYQVKE